MMMDGSHFEKTLSVCCLEIHNLKNYRRGFYYVYDSRYKDNERRADQNDIPTAAPPRKSEPVSPINILAGYML